MVLSGKFSTSGLLIGLGLSVVYIAVGYVLLRYYFGQALKKGFFIRFLTDAW